MARKFSTPQVAKMLGMWQPHLQRAITEGKVPAPPITRIGGIRVRLWSRRDVERARKALGGRKRPRVRSR
jgi:predicted DNA-binding transcriptional regulator AlpA